MARGPRRAPFAYPDMRHALSPMVSYCDVGGQLLFLDVRDDRYFCLAHGPEATLRRLAASEALLPGDSEILQGLTAGGILVETAEPVAVHPCPAPPLPRTSLLDAAAPHPGRWRTLEAVSRTLASIARLKLRPLAVNLALPPLARPAPDGRAEPLLGRIAAAFECAAHLVSSHDRCLAQSLAVARAARRAGIDVQLVLGVALGPFAAHCWVQRGSVLVNDRVDTVRAYTPILVV